LERLRLADRYGVTKNGEQYTGWRALPPPIPAAPPMDLREAFIFFGSPAAAEFNDRYRELAKRFHPDTGGRPDDWLRFQRASEILRKHFAGKK